MDRSTRGDIRAIKAIAEREQHGQIQRAIDGINVRRVEFDHLLQPITQYLIAVRCDL
jgi:hypothetical protein